MGYPSSSPPRLGDNDTEFFQDHTKGQCSPVTVAALSAADSRDAEGHPVGKERRRSIAVDSTPTAAAVHDSTGTSEESDGGIHLDVDDVPACSAPDMTDVNHISSGMGLDGMHIPTTPYVPGRQDPVHVESLNYSAHPPPQHYSKPFAVTPSSSTVTARGAPRFIVPDAPLPLNWRGLSSHTGGTADSQLGNSGPTNPKTGIPGGSVQCSIAYPTHQHSNYAAHTYRGPSPRRNSSIEMERMMRDTHLDSRGYQANVSQSPPTHRSAANSSLLAGSVPEPRVSVTPGRPWRPVQPPIPARAPAPIGTSSWMNAPQITEQGLGQASGQAQPNTAPCWPYEVWGMGTHEVPSYATVTERDHTTGLPIGDPRAGMSAHDFKQRQNCHVAGAPPVRTAVPAVDPRAGMSTHDLNQRQKCYVPSTVGGWNPPRTPSRAPRPASIDTVRQWTAVHSPESCRPLGQMRGGQENIPPQTITTNLLGGSLCGSGPTTVCNIKTSFQPSMMAQGRAHSSQNQTPTRAPLGDLTSTISNNQNRPRRVVSADYTLEKQHPRDRHSQGYNGAPLTTFQKATLASGAVPGTYQGEPNLPSNQSANIAEEESCSLWIERLPADLSYPELFRQIRDVGRVFASVISPPSGQHVTSAVKLVFFDLESTERFLGKYGGGRWAHLAAPGPQNTYGGMRSFSGPAFGGKFGSALSQHHGVGNWRALESVYEDESSSSNSSGPETEGGVELPVPVPGGLVIRGHKAHIVRNKIRTASSLKTPYHTRVLLIHGLANIVTPDNLRATFSNKFTFQEDGVIDHGVRSVPVTRAATDHDGNIVIDEDGEILMQTLYQEERMVEFRFGSFRCQAEWGWKIVKMEMAEAGVGVMYGRDVCDRYVEGEGGESDGEKVAARWEGPRGKGGEGFSAWEACFRGCGCEGRVAGMEW